MHIARLPAFRLLFFASPRRRESHAAAATSALHLHLTLPLGPYGDTSGWDQPEHAVDWPHLFFSKAAVQRVDDAELQLLLGAASGLRDEVQRAITLNRLRGRSR